MRQRKGVFLKIYISAQMFNLLYFIQQTCWYFCSFFNTSFSVVYYQPSSEDLWSECRPGYNTNHLFLFTAYFIAIVNNVICIVLFDHNFPPFHMDKSDYPQC